jgi:adenosylmethionine---8-amino-7-oxononanoate aminotransferase
MIAATSKLWLPFTQMQSFDAGARTFVRGEGTDLVDARGRRVFDATSSIWTIVHGHGHPALVSAVARQAALLDHATTLGATNPAAETLARMLCESTGMDYTFFGGDGASAIEAAIKMALQYWRHAGEPQRTRFIRLRSAYHGDTAGAMSLSDIAAFKENFGPVTFETRSYADAAPDEPDVAAVVVEPLVQAAAGMQLVAPERYAPLRGMTPLLILDEIATGFGRTGTLFAYEQLGLRPDLLCIGKGLSGGILALSAVLSRQRIYDAFLGDAQEGKQFFHGHSFAGNPIACAAAIASLDLFEREGTLERARMLASAIAAAAERMRSHPAVREIRQCGTMTGIELHDMQRAWPVANALYERNVFTRPIGPVVQLVPPLCASGEQIAAFFDALESVL